MVLAQVIGNFPAQVVLTLFYFIFFLPVGVLMRIFADSLRMRRDSLLGQKTNFERWKHPKEDLIRARKQY